jgi:ATP-binding cassette, subfamily C, bacterial
VFLLVLSGLAEGLGIAAVLPLLEMTSGTEGEAPTALSGFVESLLRRAGLPVGLEAMLILISAAMLLKGAFRLLAMKQVGYTVSQVATDLRLDFIESLLQTRWSYFVHQPLGRFANAVGAEAMRASVAYQAVCSTFAVVVQVLMYTVLALLISWQIAVLALAAGLITLIIRTPLVRRARAASRSQNELLRSISSRLTDALGGIKPVKAMGKERHLRPLLRAEAGELNRAQQKQVFAVEAVGSTREPILVVLLALVLYAVLSFTSQSFASMLLIAFIFTRLAGRISQAQGHYQEITLGEAAFWSIQDGIRTAQAAREQRVGTRQPPVFRSEISFRDVGFAYDDGLVLDRVSLVIPAGQFVALGGPSGSGKTTIADLVVGLYAPSSGSILVDGIPLESIDPEPWREQIGYVPQDPFLFHDTLTANVTMGDPEVSREEVEHALRAAGAWDFAMQLPEGLETTLGERGARLSGGQRQRIAIARALVCRPSLLILDEVTASLDPTAEESICETLRQLAGQVTILSISHRSAMMEVADVVYRIEDGTARLLRSSALASG